MIAEIEKQPVAWMYHRTHGEFIYQNVAFSLDTAIKLNNVDGTEVIPLFMLLEQDDASS